MSVKKRLLSCVFLDDVLCSFRKSGNVTVMDKCLRCGYYRRFVGEMDAEEKKFWNEVDEIRRTGVHT